MEEAPPVQSADDFKQQVTKLRDMLLNPLYRPLSREWIKINDLTSSKKGGQGTVDVGTFTYPPEWEMPEPERRVAVKKLDWQRDDPNATIKSLKSFVNEVKLRAWLLHPNIAFLLGFVEDIEKGDAWLISPWEANGNVREFLQSGEWEIPERIALIEDVAKGVEFLHTRDPPICHGDLKSFNILVNSEYHAVITDFGSARTRPPLETCKEEDQRSIPQAEAIERTVAKLLSSLKAVFDEDTKTITLTGPGWSLRWTAPEVLDDGVQDLPSDMWALGWICWEIVTGKIPFEELNNEGKIVLHTIEGRLPNIRENSQLSFVLKLCSMMSDCWLVNPRVRMDATSFRKKVEMMPSTTPEGRSSEGPEARSAMLLLQLGKTYLLQDDKVNAELHYREALEVATRTEDETAKAHALDCLGDVCRARANKKEAEKAFLEAHAIHSRIGNDLGAANALRGLGETYRSQSRNSEAEKAFLEAHAIHSRIGHDLGAANALCGLGKTYDSQTRSSEAEETLSRAHKLYTFVGDHRGIGDTLQALSLCLHQTSREGEAATHCLGALHAYQRIEDPCKQAETLLVLGSLYGIQGQDAEAENAANEALAILMSIGDDERQTPPSTLLIMARTLQSISSTDNPSMECLLQVRASLAEKGITVNDPISEGTLGDLYVKQGRYSEAEEHYRLAQAIHMSREDSNGEATVLKSLGKLYWRQEQYELAEEHFAQARVAYAIAADENGEAEALDGLMGLSVRQDKFEAARSYCMDACEIYTRSGKPMSELCTLIREMPHDL